MLDPRRLRPNARPSRVSRVKIKIRGMIEEIADYASVQYRLDNNSPPCFPPCRFVHVLRVFLETMHDRGKRRCLLIRREKRFSTGARNIVFPASNGSHGRRINWISDRKAGEKGKKWRRIRREIGASSVAGNYVIR